MGGVEAGVTKVGLNVLQTVSRHPHGHSHGMPGCTARTFLRPAFRPSEARGWWYECDRVPRRFPRDDTGSESANEERTMTPEGTDGAARW